MATIRAVVTATKRVAVIRLIREAIKLMEKAIKTLDSRERSTNGRTGQTKSGARVVYTKDKAGQLARDEELKRRKARFNANKTWDNTTRKGAIAKTKRNLGYTLTQTEKNAIIKSEKRKKKK